MIERQELHCHECQNYVQFDLDMELNGNHVLSCPVCGHEHCRVVKNGVITGERWDRRNGGLTGGSMYNVPTNTMSASTSSTFTTYSSTSLGSSSNYFTYTSWMNTTGTNTTMYRRTS